MHAIKNVEQQFDKGRNPVGKQFWVVTLEVIGNLDTENSIVLVLDSSQGDAAIDDIRGKLLGRLGGIARQAVQDFEDCVA